MKQFRSMAYPYVAWISVLIVIPMLLIIAYAFTVEGTAFFQGQFTLANFARFFSDAVFIQVLAFFTNSIFCFPILRNYT